MKRPLQLRRSRGPSVQGPVQLLRLVVTYAVQYGESLERFLKLSFRGGEEERGLGKGMIPAEGWRNKGKRKGIGNECNEQIFNEIV